MRLSSKLSRRNLLLKGLRSTSLAFAGIFTLSRESAASPDPRPEFAARGLGDVLEFHFGIRDAADDASIVISTPLEVPSGELVPFRISAPGAETVAVLTDANPEPMVMTMDQVQGSQAVLIGRARMNRSGHLACFALRNGRLGRSTQRIEIAGQWRKVRQ